MHIHLFLLHSFTASTSTKMKSDELRRMTKRWWTK
jgi:hypothetical protein